LVRNDTLYFHDISGFDIGSHVYSTQILQGFEVGTYVLALGFSPALGVAAQEKGER